jgi:hypothetical protein
MRLFETKEGANTPGKQAHDCKAPRTPKGGDVDATGIGRLLMAKLKRTQLKAFGRLTIVLGFLV